MSKFEKLNVGTIVVVVVVDDDDDNDDDGCGEGKESYDDGEYSVALLLLPYISAIASVNACTKC